MDIITGLSFVAFCGTIFLLGYLFGALAFASNLKKKLIEMGIDKETIDKLLNRKTKKA